MRAKAKSSSTPYPIWVEGEYITEPPIRPSDGAIRPAGHYIDKGGYPGANVYIGEYPSVENESTLSEILEDNVPEKYYLSPKACLGILRRAKNKGRKLPDNLRIALEQKVAEGGR